MRPEFTNAADLCDDMCVMQVVLQSILRGFPFIFIFVSLESMLSYAWFTFTSWVLVETFDEM